MASTKYFVILFLVYLNFDISPLNSAALRSGEADLYNDDATTVNYENDLPTGANDDDIGKIFETYENLYIKNANWFNDDDNQKTEKPLESQPEGESTSRDLEPTEPTAEDVVETIHNIMDEKIDTKSNRTDRTIVVVVTTNVFNINGSDDASKRQHTLLSFGTPGMIQKETSTDATLAMHNKITTEFFNSNLTPINEPSEVKANEKSIEVGPETIGLDDSLDDSHTILPVTEDEELLDVSTTEKPSKPDEYNNVVESFDNIDIRQLHNSGHIHGSHFNPAESRSFDDTLSNDDSNDILRVMKIIPKDDDTISGRLSKPFEMQVDEPADSSLMEAIENILDTDVRKAFERDIPQTHHVPLDINIEEEALYAPLKDMSEYIIEEVPFSGNYGIYKDNYKIGETLGIENDPVEPLGSVRAFDIINSTDASTITTTTEKATITKEATTTEGTTTTVEVKTTEDAAIITDAAELNISNQQKESEESKTTTITTIEMPETDEEMPKQVELSQRSETLEKSDASEHDEVSKKEDLFETEQFEANNKNLDKANTKIDVQEEVSENSKVASDTNSDNKLFAKLEEQQEDFVPESQLAVETRRFRYGRPVNQYPTFVNPDTTTDLPSAESLDVEDSNIYIDASLSNADVTTARNREKSSNKIITKEFMKTVDINQNGRVYFIEEIGSTTPTDNVVSEVVKVDEETTEQHQIIKKPGVDVDGANDVVIKPINVTIVESNNLVTTKTTSFEGRSFSDNDDTVDPLRTLVEGVELTAEITKTVDNFQSFNDPIDSIPFAANQVVENQDDLALVRNDEQLNSTDGPVQCGTAIMYIYIAAVVSSIVVLVLLGTVSYLKFRQFKRNILFTC